MSDPITVYDCETGEAVTLYSPAWVNTQVSKGVYSYVPPMPADDFSYLENMPLAKLKAYAKEKRISNAHSYKNADKLRKRIVKELSSREGA